ncbi:hypothetical protein VDGL01_06691 [Verticillium dahliae]
MRLAAQHPVVVSCMPCHITKQWPNCRIREGPAPAPEERVLHGDYFRDSFRGRRRQGQARKLYALIPDDGGSLFLALREAISPKGRVASNLGIFSDRHHASASGVSKLVLSSSPTYGRGRFGCGAVLFLGGGESPTRFCSGSSWLLWTLPRREYLQEEGREKPGAHHDGSSRDIPSRVSDARFMVIDTSPMFLPRLCRICGQPWTLIFRFGAVQPASAFCKQLVLTIISLSIRTPGLKLSGEKGPATPIADAVKILLVLLRPRINWGGWSRPAAAATLIRRMKEGIIERAASLHHHRIKPALAPLPPPPQAAQGCAIREAHRQPVIACAPAQAGCESHGCYPSGT